MSNNTERPTRDIADIEAYLDEDSDFYFGGDCMSVNDLGSEAFARVTAYIDGLEATVEDYQDTIEEQAELINELQDMVQAYQDDSDDADSTIETLTDKLNEAHDEIGRLKAEAANARDVVQTPAVEPAHEAALAKVAHLEHQVTALTQELAGAQTRLIAIGLLLR